MDLLCETFPKRGPLKTCGVFVLRGPETAADARVTIYRYLQGLKGVTLAARRRNPSF